MTRAATPEPAPIGKGQIVMAHVRLAYIPELECSTLLPDLEARAEMGRQKYGTFLRADNGRDALNDLYQEALDAIMYAHQVWLEADTEAEASDALKLVHIAERLALSVKYRMDARHANNRT